MYKCKKNELNKFISDLKVYKHFFFSKDLKNDNLILDFLDERSIYYDLKESKYILSYRNRKDKNLLKMKMPKKELTKYLRYYHKNRKELLDSFINLYV